MVTLSIITLIYFLLLIYWYSTQQVIEANADILITRDEYQNNNRVSKFGNLGIKDAQQPESFKFCFLALGLLLLIGGYTSIKLGWFILLIWLVVIFATLVIVSVICPSMKASRCISIIMKSVNWRRRGLSKSTDLDKKFVITFIDTELAFLHHYASENDLSIRGYKNYALKITKAHT